MRQALFHLWTALTVARGALGEFAVSQSTISSTSRLIPVLVGGNSLTFTPNLVTAQPGDVIQFQFAARNHTVTQSDAATPCQPAASNQGVNSGFIPFDATTGSVGTFVMPITNTEPMFLYCAQANHCQAGMVMVINGAETDVISYANAANAATANTPASQVRGGIAAKMPIGNAIVPPAAPPAPPASSPATANATAKPTTAVTSLLTTITKGGGTATATAFVTVGVGGGTATRFATATVGPNGQPAATGGVAGPSGALAANGSALLPQPATFTGGAMAAKGRIADALVLAGAMSLGAVLLTARR